MISRLRESIPDIALRTSLISGFPSESEEQHRELLEFVREVGFDRLGVFAYSKEDGTPAAAMENQIDEEIKQRRVEEIMLAQQEISAMRNESFIGRKLEVFVEGYIPDEGIYIGRTYADAHNIDGYIFFESDKQLESGVFVNCRVTDFSEYDLYGELI